MISNRCLVAVKKVINPYVAIKIKEDSSGVVTSKVRTCMNPFDEIALQEAVKLKQQGLLVEIIAVAIGEDSCQDILLQALASGADRAVFIKTEFALTSLNIAKILKHLVITNKANIALLGKQAIDDNNNQVAQMLAALLNWPQACFVSNILSNQQLLEIDKLTDFGTQKWKVQLPIIISCLDHHLESSYSNSYISVNNLMQAKKKVIETILLQDLNIINLKFDHIKVLKTCLTPKRSSYVQLSGVVELINKLKEDRVI